jgi:hypothetical protein
MNRLLLILILTFSFQTLTKADDIRDFEIEGMSIGNSALDYFSVTKLKKHKMKWYKDDKFYGVQILTPSGLYDAIIFHFKKDDKKYIIHAAGGIKDYEFNIIECYSKKKQIDKDIKTLFSNAKFSHNTKRKHEADKSGKSYITNSFSDIENGTISTGCYDWSAEIGYTDSFRITISTQEIESWFSTAQNY